MEAQKSYKSWAVSDEFWGEVKGYIPRLERDSKKVYKCAPGRGRKPISPRKTLEWILYVLRTGCMWKALPKEYEVASSIHQYFQEWLASGFFEAICSAGLIKYDELSGIDWEWQSLDSSMKKSTLGQEKV